MTILMRYLVKKNNLSIIKSKLEQAYYKQDKTTLQQISDSTQATSANHLDNISLRHCFLMAQSTLYHLDFKLATMPVQTELKDYFFCIDHWQYYDLCLLFFVANMINVENMKPYINDIIDQYLQQDMSDTTSHMVAPVIIAILEAAIMQNKSAMTNKLLEKIDLVKFHDQDFEFQTYLLFWQGISEKNMKKIHDAYHITKCLHITHTLNIFNHILEYYHIKKHDLL